MCGQTPLPSVSQQQGHGMRRWRRRVLAAHSQRRSQPQRHTAQCQQHTMRVPVALTALPGRLALHHCAAQCYMAMESSGCAEERASIAHDEPHLDDHVVGLVHVELDLGAGIGMSQAQLRASHVTLLQALDKAAGRRGEGRGGEAVSAAGQGAGSKVSPARRPACITTQIPLQRRAHVAKCWRTPRSISPTCSLHSQGTPVSSCACDGRQGIQP